MKIKLGSIMYFYETFHLTKDFGVAPRGSEGVSRKPPKKTPKTGFLGQFHRIFNNISKPITYVILCLALHHRRKFYANQTWFEVVIHEKPPKSSPKCPIWLVRETLKINNSRTTNAMKMKLGTIVYLHEIYHLGKDLSAVFRVWEGVVWKPPKKAPEIGFLLFLNIFRTITKTVIYVM